AEALRPCGYRPVRFRPYAAGKRVQVAAVWVKTDPKEDVRLYVGVSDRGHQAAWQPLRKDELQPSTLHTFTLADGEHRFSSIWRKPAPASNFTWSSDEQEHADQPVRADPVPVAV